MNVGKLEKKLYTVKPKAGKFLVRHANFLWLARTSSEQNNNSYIMSILQSQNDNIIRRVLYI